MFQRKFLFFFISLIILNLKAFSAVFVVTSNADSGPGTFRDALTRAAANGSAQKDFINFNLPDVSVAGRTINILSQLPGISSNLAIDGSTQPGAPFDVSTAKVCLTFNSTGQNGFSALTIINQSNVEIYGLYIRLLNLFSRRFTPIGIHIMSTNNVQLGDVNKGNVIAGFFFPFAENDDFVSESMGLIVKSNFFSIQSDGLTVTDDFAPNASNVYGNISIGGNAAEGNLFAKEIQFQMNSANKLATILFQNNKSGVNYNLTAAFQYASVNLSAAQNTPTTNSVVIVEDNIMCANGDFDIGLILTRLGGTVNIVRNYIGVDKAKNKLGSSEYGIYVQLCKEVHIGDNNTSDANYIGYNRPIIAETTGNLTFTKNSFFCTTNNLVYFLDPPGQQRTQCNTTIISANSVSGTATPNADIELYYADICKTCAPQTYFASTTANANGNWTYNGPISGTVIANATYNNMSSEFTFAHINTDNIKIMDACGGTGSITGIKAFGATVINWVDENGVVVGNSVDLLNIKPGKYKLIISNGGCSSSTDYYPINPKFTLDVSSAAQTAPVCGDSGGSISGLNIINSDNGQIAYSWTDANSKVWGTAVNLQNVPAGTYSLVATGKDGCVQTYGPITLQDQNKVVSAPSIDNIKLCSAGDVAIKVNSPSTGYSYRLYDSETSVTPLDEVKNGVFNITVKANRSYYISEAYFSCESMRTQVQINVGLLKSPIANTFTPNGDGINDLWTIAGIEDFPGAEVQIFSRSGQKVFESKGYAKAFDGKLNGKELPVGVYYYVINLSTYCRLLSGSLTILR